jgi:hypothetical protein
MREAGFFHGGGVLTGRAAFEAYAGPLGIRIGGQASERGETYFVQFGGVS